MKRASPEHKIQVEIFDRLSGSLLQQPYGYGFMFAIPNGGFRHMRTAINLKAEGVRPGVPDICVIHEDHFGEGGRVLFMEVKADSRLSEDQKRFCDHCGKIGVGYYVVRSVAEAASVLHNYGLISDEKLRECISLHSGRASARAEEKAAKNLQRRQRAASPDAPRKRTAGERLATSLASAGAKVKVRRGFRSAPKR